MPDCASGHDWQRVGTRDWETGRRALDEQYQTGVLECRDCDAKRWQQERRTTTLDEWRDV